MDARRANNVGTNIPTAAYIRLLSPVAWFRFNTGITVTGAGVSQWDDQSGNARHLKQGTDTNRPALQADGSILFDGADNFLKCDAFTLAQPETVYLLFKQVTWTASDRVFDGDASVSGAMRQVTASPQLGIITGTSAVGTVSLTLDTYGVIAAVFSGASSLVQLNNGTPASGDAGSADMGGFTLARTGGGGNEGNIQVKEVILCAAAHDAATRARVIRYLSQVGGLGI